jgi:hypothetical protein
VALNERGEIWIVEIKSSLEDLRAGQKWHEYRAHRDRLFFAFTRDLPCEFFSGRDRPDRGGCLWRPYALRSPGASPEAATRKQMTIRFAIAAAQRINRLIDPQGHGEF